MLRPYNSGSILHLFPFLAMSSILLHLIMCLDWFKVQWFNKYNSVANWEFVLMTYCVILFGAMAYGICHII